MNKGGKLYSVELPDKDPVVVHRNMDGVYTVTFGERQIQTTTHEGARRALMSLILEGRTA